MTTNAPEEIYLLPEVGNPNGLSICWYDAPYRTGAIEYIRTDAFIEKACEYIANNMRCDGYTLQTKAKFIRDFRKYMKGE